jgi:hypothetical protein
MEVQKREFSLSLLVRMPVILKRDKSPNSRGQYISRVEEDESHSETVVQEIRMGFEVRESPKPPASRRNATKHSVKKGMLGVEHRRLQQSLQRSLGRHTTIYILESVSTGGVAARHNTRCCDEVQ